MSTFYSPLDIKVRDLVNSCRSTDTLHPVVSRLFQVPGFKQTFWDTLNQDLHVICQRSQSLVHGEITVIQKAFAILVQTQDVIPAVNFYVDEILGLKFVSETERATILDTMIHTRHSILSYFLDSSEPADSVSRSNDGDEKLKRLFIIYHDARKDFDATPAKTLERTKSAKFLRDTTENCLAYIAAEQTCAGDLKTDVTCDGKMLDELRATLEETIAIAEQGSGGKKRRFDENWENIPQAPAKMRRSCLIQPLANSDPIPRGRTSGKKRTTTVCLTQAHENSYPNQRLDLAECKPLDTPHKLYPASASQSVRRVYRDRYKQHAQRKLSNYHVHGDRYRPAYR